MSDKLWIRTQKDGAVDQVRQGIVRPDGRLAFDGSGNPVALPVLTYFTNFAYLPSTSVSGPTVDLLTTESGTGTEVIARSTGGGANLKTQASTPADGDNFLLIGAANSGMAAGRISANSQLRWATRLKINTITAMFLSAGLNENLTDADPTGTAGEGAQFVFDPSGEFASAVANYTTNWLLAHKVDGADTYTDTGIPVIAGAYYDLRIEIGTDLKAKFYLNGTLVGTGPALTSGDTVGSFIGFELTATPGEQKDIDVCFLQLSREIGV